MTEHSLIAAKSIYTLEDGDTLDLLSLSIVERGVQFFLLISGTVTLIPSLGDQINFSTETFELTSGEYILLSAGPGSSWYVHDNCKPHLFRLIEAEVL